MEDSSGQGWLYENSLTLLKADVKLGSTPQRTRRVSVTKTERLKVSGKMSFCFALYFEDRRKDVTTLCGKMKTFWRQGRCLKDSRSGASERFQQSHTQNLAPSFSKCSELLFVRASFSVVGFCHDVNRLFWVWIRNDPISTAAVILPDLNHRSWLISVAAFPAQIWTYLTYTLIGLRWHGSVHPCRCVTAVTLVSTCCRVV
jgi:hypothetical protein